MRTGRIAVFGDSIAWGSWDDECGGWVQRLKLEYMRRQDVSQSPAGAIQVFECAVPGHRVEHVKQRLVNDLESIVTETVVIAIGINDIPHETYEHGTDSAKFAADYQFVLATSMSLADRVVAVSATNVFDEGYGYDNDKIGEINSQISKVAGQLGVPLVDVSNLFGRDDLIADGLHPNSQGHEKLFHAVLTQLDAMGVR